MLEIGRAMAEVLCIGTNEGKYLKWSPSTDRIMDARWDRPRDFPLPDKLRFSGYEEGKGSVEVVWGKDPKGNQLCITCDDSDYCLILQNVEHICLEDELGFMLVNAQPVDAGYGANLCSCL